MYNPNSSENSPNILANSTEELRIIHPIIARKNDNMVYCQVTFPKNTVICSYESKSDKGENIHIKQFDCYIYGDKNKITVNNNEYINQGDYYLVFTYDN